MSDIDPNNDPLNADVSTVDTSFPVIPEGRLLRFEIRKPFTAEAKNSKAKALREGEAIRVLTIPCHTLDDQTGTKGEKIGKGFPIYHRITITETDKQDAVKIGKNVALICKAAGVSGVKVSEIIANPAVHLDGKVFEGKTKVQKETADFDASNALTPVIPG